MLFWLNIVGVHLEERLNLVQQKVPAPRYPHISIWHFFNYRHRIGHK